MLDENVIKQAEQLRQLLLKAVSAESIEQIERCKRDAAEAGAALTKAHCDFVSHGLTKPKKLSDADQWVRKQNELAQAVPVYAGIVETVNQEYRQAQAAVRAMMMEVLMGELRECEARYAQFIDDQRQRKHRAGIPVLLAREVLRMVGRNGIDDVVLQKAEVWMTGIYLD